MRPVLVLNQDKLIPGSTEHAAVLGFDYILAEGVEVPAVQIVPTVPGGTDRRFEAAKVVLAGLVSDPNTLLRNDIDFAAAAKTSVQLADALLAELAK